MILRGAAGVGHSESRGRPRTILSRRVFTAFLAGTAAATVFTAGCGSASLGPNTSSSTVPGPAPQAGGSDASAARLAKVLTIVEENHTATSALNGMPFLAGLARTYGYSTDYRALTHPSLPNYLALAGGSTFDVGDDDDPAAHPIAAPSVFDQTITAGHTAKAYEESMPTTCALSNSGDYAVRHNPWAYFADNASRVNCQRYDVPAGTPAAGSLRDDITAGALPTLGWVTPNLCHDAHDCDLATADGWLHRWLPMIMAGPDYRAGRLAIVITFDENDGSDPNTVLTTVVSPNTSHVVSATPYTHYSWTRLADEIAAIPLLRSASTAPSLRPAFHL